MHNNQEKFLSISEAANYLGVSEDTLRRWDNKGAFRATFISPGKHRYYSVSDLERKTKGLFLSAFDWASSNEPNNPPNDWYCPTSDIFKARLERMTNEMLSRPARELTASLIVSAAGEVGNNSYDHNLGKWPDVPGAFFAYDFGKRVIVLADRGVGILETLRIIRPELNSHQNALKMAFTEIVTGRAPEHRGNGLKYVRNALSKANASIYFQTGDAVLEIKNGKLNISTTNVFISGCLAMIRYK